MPEISSSTTFIQSFLPRSRRLSLARGESLPEHDSGACLFADISGFTPLTESLGASLGPQQGAESLTAIINDIFEGLIAQVHAHGGDVLGFAGDAITVWFCSQDQDSLDSGVRALSCAIAMQSEMARFAAIPTPDGKTHMLTMKIGLAHGLARRFTVGDPAWGRFDVLTGATLDRMAAAEHHAAPGEIICSAEIVSAMGDGATWGDDRQGYRPLHGLSIPLGPKTPPEAAHPLDAIPELPLETLRPWFPPSLFAWLAGAQETFLAELRPVVSAFIHFDGIDYTNDPQAGEKLNQYVTTVQRIADRFGGSLVRLDYGDKGSLLHVMFGAPQAHEDDEIRSVGFALDLQTEVRQLPFITGQSIGMAKGQVYAGALGATSRRGYTVMGDEVNASARLMQACQPGQILVSQRIMQAAQKRFMFHQFPGFQVKGKYEPVPVATPVAPLPPMPQIPAGPLVGRERELAQLDDALNALLSGASRVLRIEGGTGIGKSRLAVELAQRAMMRGVRALVGSGQSTALDTPYAPWRDVIRTLFGLQSAWPAMQQAMQIQAMLQWINPEWLPRVPLLGDLLGLEIPDTPVTAAFDARLRQQSLFALLGDLLARMALQQPMLILIEDCHWLDEASASLVESLGLSLAAARVLLAVTHCPPTDASHPLLPGLSGLPNAVEIALSELDASAVETLVTARLGGALPPEILSLIQERAQGNPLFVEELAESLRETSRLQMVAGRWTLVSGAGGVLKLPDTIQGVVLSRLDRLDEQSKLTLKVASVAGRVFDPQLVSQVHPAHTSPDELQSQLNAMQRRDFVQPESAESELAYHFRHNVTQEVVYGTLLEAQRRELHRAVGETLEMIQPEAVEHLAHHFSRGGPAARDKTLFYLDKAARRAQQNYANETALNYYAQALALEVRWQWRQGQIEVLHILGRREDEQAALQSLEAMPGASPYEISWLWGQYHEAVGDYPQAQSFIERALSIARERSDCTGEAQCLAQLGLIARRQGNYELAKDWYNQALNLFPGEGACSKDVSRVLADALTGLGVVHRQQSCFDESKACYQRALALSRDNGNRKGESDALNSLGVTAYYQRFFAEALGYYEQALEIRREIGDRAGEGISLISLAQVNVLVGNYDRAEGHFNAALTIQQTTGNRWEEINVWMGIGVLHMELGNLDQAEISLRNGLKLSQAIGDEAGQAYVLTNLGLVARDRSNFAQAEQLLVEGLALAKAQDDKSLEAIFQSYLATVYFAAGRLGEAQAQAQAALEMRQSLGLRLYAADDLSMLALVQMNLGQSGQALQAARQALEILDECGGEGPEFPARDYFYCHQVLAGAGETEPARGALQAAHRLVTARAGQITNPALRQSFLEKVTINRQITGAVSGLTSS